MNIANINFIIERDDFNDRREFLLLEAVPALSAPGCRLRLMLLADVIGASDMEEQPRSISLQATFGNVENRRRWLDSVALPFLAGYQKRFGERGLFMVSLLDDIL